MKFICDDNLGKLAGFLRILGFDTEFSQNIDDSRLLRTAAAEHRFLLTRDRKLMNRSHPYDCLILEFDDPLKQLSTVVKDLNLRINTESLFGRCSRCNKICETIDKNDFADKIFPYILKTQTVIKHCPACGRFYWKGSHYKSILDKLKNAIDDEDISGDWPDINRD